MSQFFLLLLLPLLLLSPSHAAFQHITVTTSSQTKNYGCKPSTFTSIPSTFESYSAALVNPEDACYPEDYTSDVRFWTPDNSNELNGKIALVRRCKTCNCYFENKAQAAVNSGASGVIIINDNLDAVIPVTAGQADMTYTSPVPVCMVTFDDGEEILDFIEDDGFSVSFEGVFPEDLNQVPEHPDGDYNFLTYLDVLTPWPIKFRYPSSTCLWNPVGDITQNPITAKLVVASIKMHCPFPDNSEHSCFLRGCHVIGLNNPNEVKDNIAIFSEYDEDEYCHDVQELSAAAQNAGAIGAVVGYRELYSLPVFDAPKYSPYDYQIPTYIIPGAFARDIREVVEEGGEEVIVRFPKYMEDTSLGVIPEQYFPSSEVLGALPQTAVCVRSENSSSRSCFTAGQAMFNPSNSPPLQKELVLATIDASCHDEDMEDGKEGSGADCVSCMSLLNQDLAVSNRYSIEDKIVLVKAAETFCINEWEDLIDNLVAHGAVGMVVGNENDYTYTMVDSQPETSPIPVFNVHQTSLAAILEILELRTYDESAGVSEASKATVSFPRISSGSVVAKNITSHHLQYDSFGLTQLDVVRPTRFSGIVEAGQANFNKEFSNSNLLMLSLTTFYNFCSSETDGQVNSFYSCHKCNLLSSPLTSTFPHGGVAVIDMTTAGCFQPIGSVVKFVQEQGAEGVIVVLEDQELVTLSNGDNEELNADIKIPVFNVARESFEDILNELKLGPHGDMIKIRLPKISFVEMDTDGDGDTSNDDSAGNGTEVEGIYIADETIDEFDKWGYDGEVEDDSNAKGRRGGLLGLGKGGNKAGMVASLVIVSVVLFFVVGRNLYKKRERNRMLVAYNQLQAGTQVGNTMVGDEGVRWSSGVSGGGVNGGGGNGATTTAYPHLAAGATRNDVIITARPWVPAKEINKSEFGMFGLLDFRANKESDSSGGGGNYGKMQGTVVEMTDIETAETTLGKTP
ncbi:hypothetical protein TL16_g03458 [Triparma laevis f. inornata]|uniref:PA domain-containing protein n=2 Tax=Triparma laevis TaxID=1534972 RepID=A0A9W6ZK26_9STRA|nr:hypothetical protein TrLO_g8684 [Triparma laevis f. longispina]GMH62346.1 hypothetical protein TL16_g03458 [Triparma laevis f. inornata]